MKFGTKNLMTTSSVTLKSINIVWVSQVICHVILSLAYNWSNGDGFKKYLYSLYIKYFWHDSFPFCNKDYLSSISLDIKLLSWIIKTFKIILYSWSTFVINLGRSYQKRY